jgi:hypothetical protein
VHTVGPKRDDLAEKSAPLAGPAGGRAEAVNQRERAVGSFGTDDQWADATVARYAASSCA